MIAHPKSLIVGLCLLATCCTHTLIRMHGLGSSDTSCQADTSGLIPSESVRDSGSDKIQLVQEPGRTSFRPALNNAKLMRQDRLTQPMREAFKEAIGESWKSTVRLLHAGGQVALGAIVDGDGWIVTKASQLPAEGSELYCELHDNRELPVKVSSKVFDLDIALLKVDARGLKPVEWATQISPQRGKWLATTDGRKIPLKVGVISAGIQSVKSEYPKLGISFNDSAQITMVLPGSGAYSAGLRVEDVIQSVNGKPFTPGEPKLSGRLQEAIRNAGRPGEFIRLGLVRNEQPFEVEAKLMDLTYELLDETEMEVNGRVSARATGFNRVFLHDTVLEPNECGGPLVNLDGQVVGINIARAGRVTSYGLPVDALRPVVDGMLAQAKLVSLPSSNAVETSRPIR